MGVESRIIGKKGEVLAERHLKKVGLTVIKRNFKTNMGEIDLICEDGEQIVFVEVKNYSSRNFYHPSFSIDKKKRQCMINAAKQYIFKNNLFSKNARFDVVAIYRDEKQKTTKIEHFKSAFDVEVLYDEY